MKHKKVLVLFFFLLIISNAFCQKGLQNLKEYDFEPYHFGFLLGYNQMGFALKVNNSKLNTSFPSSEFGGLNNNQTAYVMSAEPNSTTGFTIGILGNLRLTDHFDLRFIPAISFGERDINYNYVVVTPLAKNDSQFIEKSIKSTLLEFPLNLKYKGNRINNARPYIIGGIKYVLDLSSDAKKSTENQSNELFTIKLKQYDLYGELGAGFDFYFDWFKMGLEAKMSYGFRDMLIRDNSMYTSVVNRLNSKIFQFSITFE